MKLSFVIPVLCSSMLLASCASNPSADNYGQYMNNPNVAHGASGNIDSQLANKAAWNNVKATEITSVRRTPTGAYAANPNTGVLTVRAVLVNSGNAPAQGNWRCRFFDSNNLPLYEAQSNQMAKKADDLGWHTMVVYPLRSKSQTADANVIHCKALTANAVTSRIEFHDTSNDITVYHR